MAETCQWCGDALGGGKGGWFSLTTTFETCNSSPTSFHGPEWCHICDVAGHDAEDHFVPGDPK